MKKNLLSGFLTVLFLAFSFHSFAEESASTDFYKVPSSYESAYKYRTGKPDKSILAFIKNKNVDSLRETNPSEYVKTVTSKINELSHNDFEKVKFSHDVICLLVRYDAKSFWANVPSDQSWQTILKTRLAVCEGYANLFQRFMKELNISSKKVSGYARGIGTNVSNENPEESNHAWNIVKIDDCWYTIDCTWDSGYMKGKTSVQEYNTDWLFLKPQYFIYSHFPSEEKNQLLDVPYSVSDFSLLPDFRPKLFAYTGASLKNIRKINEAADSFTAEYKIRDGYVLTFGVNKIGGRQINNRTWIEKSGDKKKITINFPEAGEYLVTIYYWKEGFKSGTSCGQFIVKASSGNKVKYAMIYPVAAKNAEVVFPKENPLEGGKSVDFKVHLEDVKFAAVIIDNELTYLTNDGKGNFSGSVDIPEDATELSVCISDTGKGSWEAFAVYSVR